MDVSLLTIGNMLGQPDGPVQVGPRPGAPSRDTRFSTARQHSRPPTDSARPAHRHHARAETPGEPASERRRDFKEAIDKQTRPGKPEEASDNRQPKRQNAESANSDQSDAASPVVVQSPADGEGNKEAASSASEPKASQQLAQLIEGVKTEKATPNVAESPEPSEIKLSGTAQKKQPGSDAVAANASLAKQIRSEVKPSVSDGALAGVKAAAKSSNAPQLTPETSVAGDARTANTGKEHTIAADSLPAVDAKTPVASAAATTDKISPDSGVQTPKMDESPAVQSVQTQKPSIPKTDQVAPDSDKAPGTTQEPLPTTEAEPVRQAPTRPIATSGKNSGNLGNNTENPASEPAQVQTGTAHAGTDGGSDAGGKPLPDSAQILSQTPSQTAVTGQAPISAVEAETMTTSEQPQTTPVHQLGPVGNQVLESVRSSLSQQTGDKEITIQLHPPELGKVSVKFQEQGAEITGTLEVSKAQTKTEIEQVLPEMIRSLADSGVAIKRLEVVLSQNEESNQQSSREPLLQNGEFGQRDSANPGQSGGQQTAQTYYGPTGHTAYQYQTAADIHDMLVTNTSIDMLV